MEPEWIVRVEGKEFGPVDLETLHDWREDGRLIPTNEVRSADREEWRLARDVPELFPPVAVAQQQIASRSLGQIIAETCRIYGRGFPQFFCLALLVGIPSCLLQVSLGFVNMSDSAVVSAQSKWASAVAVVMLVLVLVAWPIFISGLQFASAEIIAGGRPRLGEILQRAVSFWPRMARLCVIVYASYVFWTLVPVLAIIALVSGEANLLALLFALAILAFQVYMAGRLFVNFMFWQQTATLGAIDGVEALRESKELARSRGTAPRMQRPLYLGAILASLWLLVLLAFSSAAELPFMFVRLQSVTNLDDALALVQTLRNAPVPDALTIGSYVLSSLVHAALRPLLGISFVVLYFEARRGRAALSS
ncbi:MAG: DUF4339 domain-containing protein [Verrucomicrobiota bacterium]|nr:DUF4339 domain-containing protein [Verrucomicrobiota bacterium]